MDDCTLKFRLNISPVGSDGDRDWRQWTQREYIIFVTLH